MEESHPLIQSQPTVWLQLLEPSFFSSSRLVLAYSLGSGKVSRQTQKERKHARLLEASEQNWQISCAAFCQSKPIRRPAQSQRVDAQVWWWEKLQGHIVKGLNKMKGNCSFVQSTTRMYECSFNYAYCFSIGQKYFKMKRRERNRRQHRKPDKKEDIKFKLH